MRGPGEGSLRGRGQTYGPDRPLMPSLSASLSPDSIPHSPFLSPSSSQPHIQPSVAVLPPSPLTLSIPRLPPHSYLPSPPQRFTFLHPDRIMDAAKRRPGHPAYDPRTLYIPPAWFKVRAPVLVHLMSLAMSIAAPPRSLPSPLGPSSPLQGAELPPPPHTHTPTLHRITRWPRGSSSGGSSRRRTSTRCCSSRWASSTRCEGVWMTAGGGGVQLWGGEGWVSMHPCILHPPLPT